MAVTYSGPRVWLGALCVAAIAGCGGRTSMFTPDDDPNLGSSVPGGGANGSSGSPGTITAPPTPSGGSTSTPAGGATSIGVAGGATAGGSPGIAGAPSIGSGGEAGTFGGSALAACKNFCGEVAMGNCFGDDSECVNNCSGELGASPLCLQLGQAVMNCFLPFIQSSAGNCSEIDNLADAKCAPQLDQFQQCSDSGVPTPAPTPVPLPIPQPASNCSTSGSTSPTSCNLVSKCTDGSFYMVNCKQGSPNESFCSCESGNSSGGGTGAGFNLNESVAFACYDGISTCGGPAPTLPK
jgi:hypothetical protein